MGLGIRDDDDPSSWAIDLQEKIRLNDFATVIN